MDGRFFHTALPEALFVFIATPQYIGAVITVNSSDQVNINFIAGIAKDVKRHRLRQRPKSIAKNFYSALHSL